MADHDSSSDQTADAAGRRVSELKAQARKAGMRITPHTTTVIQILDEAEDHPTAEDIFARARERDPSISSASVYRILNKLEESELVRRQRLDSDRFRYEIADECRHHLVDLESGQVIGITDPDIDALKERIAKRHGFEIVDFHFELFGRKRDGDG
jgi:Fur family ferric uptake transcriptional regulator